MYYLRIENSSFSVLRSDWMGVLGDTVKDMDIPITEEDYNKYSKLSNNAKQFRIRETPTGAGLFDYIEECEPVSSTSNDKTNNEEKEIMKDLQTKVSNLENEVVELKTKIEKLEKLMTGVIVSKLNTSASTKTI